MCLATLAEHFSRSGRTVRRRRPPFGRVHNVWLDRPKNLSGRALSEAIGLVRLRHPDGSSRRYVERADVEARLEGWLLD